MKVGIIGFGRIGKVHAESLIRYASGIEVKAIADPFISEESKLWAKANGVKEVYSDYEKILADKEIDIVLICCPTDQHFIVSKKAILSGKHVFCEKPVSHSVEEILEIKKLLEKHNVLYQVGFNRRFDKNFATLKEKVASGMIGDLHILKITSRDPAPPPISYVKVSGGMFLDMTIHDFDMVRFVSGEEVEEVFVFGGVMVDEEIGKAGDIDTAIISLKLKSGALAVIDNSREAAYGYDQRVEAFGSKGQIIAKNELENTTVIATKDGILSRTPKYFFLERYMQAYTEEIKQFVESIKSKSCTVCGVDDGLKPVLIGLAAKKSLKENRPVKIAEIEKEYGIKS